MYCEFINDCFTILPDTLCEYLTNVSLDDATIKLWDWEKKWTCTQIFEGHGHYVMQIKINPKDNNTFASASLDKTIKVSTFFHVYEVNHALIVFPCL